MTAQAKKIEFGVYKYDHPNFGPLMLLLDLDDDQSDKEVTTNMKKPSITRFRDQQQKKMDTLLGNNRYRKDPSQNNSNEKNTKRTLSHRPPVPGERRLSKINFGKDSIEKIQRRSMGKSVQRQKSLQNGLLLPNIIRRK